MNFISISTAFICLVLASCAHSEPKVSVDLDSESIENFRKKYAGFIISNPPAQFPPPANAKQFRVRQTVSNMGSLDLQLLLAERWSVASNSIYRTESRYRLTDEQGRLLAAAESTLAITEIDPDGTGRVTVYTDAETNSFFIAEEQSWATQRYIIIAPADDSSGSTDKAPAAWTVQYVQIPLRDSKYGPYVHPEILGIRNRKLYFIQDSKTYAIPFEELEKARSLDYSIG